MSETQPGRMRPVAKEEALRLLASVPYGRIVFTERALPAVRPVNHLIDSGAVIVRTHAGAAILRTVGQVVAYEADHVSEGPRLDWSVVVIGVVDLLMDHVLRIRPQLVTGYVLDTQDVPASA